MSDVSSSTNKPSSATPAVGWGPAAALIVCALAFIGAQLIASLLLVAVTYTWGPRETWLTTTAGQFYFVVIADILILAIIWAFLRRRRTKLSQVGFHRKPAPRDLGYALLGYLTYFVGFFLLVVVAGILTQINLDQKQDLGFDHLLGTADRLMALVSLVLLPPIVEEIIFRGFLFTGLRKKMTFIWATVLTSFVFAGLHLLGGGDGEGLLWIAGLDTLVLSFVLCYLREKTGALWASIAVHAIKNIVAFTFLL